MSIFVLLTLNNLNLIFSHLYKKKVNNESVSKIGIVEQIIITLSCSIKFDIQRGDNPEFLTNNLNY